VKRIGLTAQQEQILIDAKFTLRKTAYEWCPCMDFDRNCDHRRKYAKNKIRIDKILG